LGKYFNLGLFFFFLPSPESLSLSPPHQKKKKLSYLALLYFSLSLAYRIVLET
jgi:hypothetical protein